MIALLKLSKARQKHTLLACCNRPSVAQLVATSTDSWVTQKLRQANDNPLAIR